MSDSAKKMVSDIRNEIQKCIETGYKKFVIAPFGFFGKMTKKVLNEEFEIKEIICLDNNNFDMKEVFPIKYISEISNDCIVLLATANEYYRYQLVSLLHPYVELKKIKVCVSYSEMQKKILFDKSKVKLDFLCVGFAKCGTSSMQEAFINHPQVYLPQIKETFFLKNVSEMGHQRFKKIYSDSRAQNKLLGGIEPTYFDIPETVYHYFGPHIKIIMCVANPIKALYSRFKMAMRDMGSKELELIKKYQKVTPALFDEWVNDKLQFYRYMDYINFYLNYFPHDHIKVIISEKLYSFPGLVMEEIQQFLEIDNKITYEKFPHANKGNTVSKNYAAACINKKIRELILEVTDLDVEEQVRKMRHDIFSITTVPYLESMQEETYHRLFHYFCDSIHELETFLGESLKNIWY